MRTRLAVLLTVVALSASACVDGGSSSPEASAEAVDAQGADTAEPSDTGPPRVLFAGDSLMQEIHASSAAALGDSAETRFILSPSLIRDDAQRLVWQNTLDEFDPDVVVANVSHWERLTIGVQTVADFEDVDAYTGLVALPFATFVTDSGAELIWLSAPHLRDERVTAVYAVMNESYRAATDATDDARFVDLAPALTDDRGAYADTLADEAGVVRRARNVDGIHLCPAGAIRVTDLVLVPLAASTDAAPTPDWQTGAWRNEAPFDQPEECPPL